MKAANFHDTRHLWQSRKPCPCNACLSGDLLSALTACEYSGTADAGGWNETSTRALSAAEVDIDEAALQGQANDWLAAADVEHVVALRSEPSNAGCACTSLEPGSHFTWNNNTHAKNAKQRSIKKDCMGTFSAAGLLELELVAFENFAVRLCVYGWRVGDRFMIKVL